MNTKQLKQKILSLAIRGQLVPQDPSNEPASELLKRIAAEKAANAPKDKKQKPTKDTSHYQQYPFEVPKGWVWCKLGEIVEHNTGKTLDKTRNTGIFKKYITTSNLYWNSFDFTELREMPFEEKELAKFTAVKGDLLICEGGDAGRSAIWLENDPICFQNHIHRVRPYGNISSLYLYYYMLYIYHNKDIKQYLKGVGIQSLSGNALASIAIPLPPLKEQQRIVAEIDRLFTLIDQLEEDKAALQQLVTQLKSKILSLAIRGQLVPQDANDEPAEALLKRINPAYKSSGNLHYKNLPKGWEVIPIKMVCKLKDGEKKENIKLPYLDVKYFRGKTTGTIKENGKYIPKNTILILVDGENSGEIFYALSEGYQGSTMKILEIDPIVDRAYILHFIASYQKELKENKVGSAIPHLNKKLFGELQLPFPPYNEQKRIAERITELFNIIDNIQNALNS